MKGIAQLCIVMAMTQFLLVLGCQSMPSDTRSGHVKELIIRGPLPPEEGRVSVGDEIRWINHSSGSLRIVFPVRIIGKISCRRNFSGWVSGGAEVTLGSNESASLCFNGSISSTYLVRMTRWRGGEVNTTGTIHISDPSEVSSPAQQMPNAIAPEIQP